MTTERSHTTNVMHTIEDPRMHPISSSPERRMPLGVDAGAPARSIDRGETLIEVLLTIVIVGLTVTALLSSLATVGNAGNAQRNAVLLDVAVRNYAEATKTAARGCTAGATYTVVVPGLLPTGFTLSVAGVGAGAGIGIGSTCPSVLAPQTLTLTVRGPHGSHATLQITVNTR